MRWHLSHRFDSLARPLADRHYNRRAIGSPQFAPPGRCVVLVIPGAAFWISSWPFPEYVRHAWPGAWVCSAFRNERRDLYLSSSLITEALAATRFYWDPPPLGMITFIDEDKTRRKRDPGRCYRKAGFRSPTRSGRPWFNVDIHGLPFVDGMGRLDVLDSGTYNPDETEGGLVALQLLPHEMPSACAPIGQTLELIA